MAFGKAPEVKEIILPKLDLREMEITVVGDSILVVNQFTAKAKQEILDDHMKKAKKKKAAKDPQKLFEGSMYKMKGGGYGFPAIGFKSAAVSACSFVDGVTKVAARGAFHIDGELVPIQGKPTLRTDMVRIGMGKFDVRVRAEFKKWKAKILIRFNTAILSPEQIVNLFNHAGFSVGVGENRPGKSGNTWGMFHVE
ncbi:hypothetical protein LCGC14_3042220 [marine sediment metagenome]|uniref:Uncharacterized protein n=1 Tax=marine sediment metagenome TaxID=412755 RepID=A0A0F8YX67_9ZZZZ